jgi:hypothetical protein
MEMGGKISINCPKTGYKAEVDFKLKVGVVSDGMSTLLYKWELIPKILDYFGKLNHGLYQCCIWFYCMKNLKRSSICVIEDFFLYSSLS